ncbi:MAG: glycosyltransferase family 1 protein [Candidatus Jorgensenbacteria bacterium]
MTILVDVRMLRRGVHSGVEEYTRLLLEHLLALNRPHRYVLFANGVRGKLPPSLTGARNVSVVSWNVPNRLLNVSFRFLRRPLVDRRVACDVVFSPHLSLLTTSRAPHIMTFHDLSFIHHPEFFSRRMRLWHWLQNYRAEARRAARLIAVSEFTRRDLIQTFGVAPERVKTVHSGVDPFYRRLPENDAGLRAFRDKHDLARPFILFVGTLEPRKNVPGIIRAFDILKTRGAQRELALVLVGRRGWLYDGIARAIRGSPHRSDIRLWGSATGEELRYLYNLAAVFTYPSFFEGFGFPVLEAQACGAPVVASNVTSLPEILGESALLVDPSEVQAIAGAVRQVLESEALRDGLQERGFVNVKRFSWQRAAEETLKVFERSLEV